MPAAPAKNLREEKEVGRNPCGAEVKQSRVRYGSGLEGGESSREVGRKWPEREDTSVLIGERNRLPRPGEREVHQFNS